MLINMKGEINSSTVIVREFNTHTHTHTHTHLWIDQLNRKLARKHKV